MSNKSIYKGKVYGDTLSSKLTLIAKELDTVENDGRYRYEIDDPDDTKIYVEEDPNIGVVEIAGGGRIRYGTSDNKTIIC